MWIWIFILYFCKFNPILRQFLFRAYGNSHFHSASNSECHLKLEYLCFSLSLFTDTYVLLLISMKDLRTNLNPALVPIHALTLPFMLMFLNLSKKVVCVQKWVFNYKKMYINKGMFKNILMRYMYGKSIFPDVKFLPGCPKLRTAENSKYILHFKRIFDTRTMSVWTSSRCVCCYPLLPLRCNVLRHSKSARIVLLSPGCCRVPKGPQLLYFYMCR
jgi:hypothetical protein